MIKTVGDLVQHLLQFDMALPVRVVNASPEDDVSGRLDPIADVAACDPVDDDGEPTGRKCVTISA